MGSRQTGPTFSAYDEYFTVRTPDGQIVRALGEFGVLRRIVCCRSTCGAATSSSRVPREGSAVRSPMR